MSAEHLDLAGIRARAEAATPGPWDPTAWKEAPGDAIVHNGISPLDDLGYDVCELPRTPRGSEDADHIAGMDPSTTLALVAEVERLRTAVEGVEALGRNWLRLSATAMTDEVREWTEAAGRSVLDRIGATS